jgi:hypothetical protein
VPYLPLPELQRNSGPSRQADGVTPTPRLSQPSTGGTQ